MFDDISKTLACLVLLWLVWFVGGVCHNVAYGERLSGGLIALSAVAATVCVAFSVVLVVAVMGVVWLVQIAAS